MTTQARSIPTKNESEPLQSETQKQSSEEMKTPRDAGRSPMESDVEPKKEPQTPIIISTAPTGVEQKEADELLLWLARYPVDNNHPRSTTGTIRVRKSGEVMTVQSDERVVSMFQKLTTEGFLSAPVLDSKSRYTGYNVDLLDLVHHTLQCFHEWRSTSATGTTSPLTVTTDFWNSYFEREEFIRSHAMDVITRNPMRAYRHEHIATRDFSTLYCMEVMARLGQHRVVVIDRAWFVTNILTQSMIISLISQNMNRLGSLRFLKVCDLMQYLPLNVQTVKDSDITADAFNSMAKMNVSGVGVVTSNGDLVDTLSVRDLRGIGPKAQQFLKLWWPVSRFKEEVRQLFPSQTPPRPLFVTPSDTFEKIIGNMHDGNIHRVWIVQSVNDMKPLRVCTQRDVICILLTKMGQRLPISF